MAGGPNQTEYFFRYTTAYSLKKRSPRHQQEEKNMRCGAIVIATLRVSLSAFAADPFVGTWKPTNVARWKLSPGARERRKSELITFESVGKDQLRQTVTTLDRKVTNATNTQPQVWLVDGKEHKSDEGFTSKAERIDLGHFLTTALSSKGRAVFDYVVSEDEKTLTLTRKGAGLTSGRPLDELLVYEKQ
jgi:hypothetical protein